MLGDRVGVVVLSAGVGNDMVSQTLFWVPLDLNFGGLGWMGTTRPLYRASQCLVRAQRALRPPGLGASIITVI